MSIVYPPKVTELLESNVKLTLKNEELNKRIAELETSYNEMSGWVARAMMKGCCKEDITRKTLQGIIDKRDLEQQAKGLQDWVDSEKDITYLASASLCNAFNKGVHLTLLDADTKAKRLRKQAKGGINQTETKR